MHSLIDQYREMHANAHFSGVSIYAYCDEIEELVKTSGAKTLLDYGSGKGRQYVEGRIHELWGGIMPTLYDPAVAGIDTPPDGQFDGVFCIDVLEHIPEDELDATLGEINGYARKWAFFSICCEPAKKCLPDGRNVHVTLRPEGWWNKRIIDAFGGATVEIHIRFERPGVKKKPRTAKKLPRDERVTMGWAT